MSSALVRQHQASYSIARVKAIARELSAPCLESFVCIFTHYSQVDNDRVVE